MARRRYDDDYDDFDDDYDDYEDDYEEQRPRRRRRRGRRGLSDRELSDAQSKKLACGLCGILIGGLGVHKFILGMTNAGVIQIVLSIFTCGLAGFIGLIEGIIYLTKSDEDFYDTYIIGQKEWF